jgi:hypothetical protein
MIFMKNIMWKIKNNSHIYQNNSFWKYNKLSILKYGKCIYCISSNKYIWFYDVYFLCKTVRNKNFKISDGMSCNEHITTELDKLKIIGMFCQ